MSSGALDGVMTMTSPRPAMQKNIRNHEFYITTIPIRKQQFKFRTTLFESSSKWFKNGYESNLYVEWMVLRVAHVDSRVAHVDLYVSKNMFSNSSSKLCY